MAKIGPFDPYLACFEHCGQKGHFGVFWGIWGIWGILGYLRAITQKGQKGLFAPLYHFVCTCCQTRQNTVKTRPFPALYSTMGEMACFEGFQE